ncbi:MAG: VanW family protein [Clostridia bacterium]|nr:VanW family protein [Clostridia bacterium]
MLWFKDKLFCDISPTCYKISLQKEIVKRHIKNHLSEEKFSKEKSQEKLPNLVYSHSSNMIKRAPGVDLTLQYNKAINIKLASEKINGIIIHPGEVFSFWETVGKTSKRRGYKEGRVIRKNKLVAGTGGGLCNLGNTVHLLVLHSPLEVTEFHSHSDALAPDEGGRVPFSAGTSVSYNNIDFKFKNNTDQDVQLLLWCEEETLFAELRSEREFPESYKIVEEDHHFQKEGEKFFRVSKIYKESTNKENGDVVEKTLVWDNHSEVMFDYDLIPKAQIR